MAQIRVYIQPRLPAATDQTAFYDFSRHVEFTSLEWEQNDQGNASTLRANIYSIMPVSTTHWNSYTGATEAIKIQAALDDQFYHLRIPPRTEIQIRDVSTNPHTILWGGVVTRVSEQRDGGAIVGSLDAIDYTALLNEAVALEFTPLANSTIKQTITSQTYSFTPSVAERTAGLSTVTVSSISIGSPYSRNLEIGDTIVVNLSDDSYDGVHKVTGVAAEGSAYKVRFQQYSNAADSVSASVTGTIVIPGFMTTNNAPQLDSRVTVSNGNIADLNPDWKWSPRNPDVSRNISNVARTTTTATITTSAPHGFGVDRVVTISLTNGPTGYSALNGSFVIASTPTDSTFTYTTVSSGTIASGAATGTAVCSGEITPTPMKGGTLSRNLQYAVEKGNGCFYLGAGTLDGSGNLTIPLNVKSLALSDLITNGLFDSNRTVDVSTIKSGASTTKTVTTSYPHGLYTGYTVTISGASGTNAADVNGNTYAVTVTSSTVFTITAATSNSLNLTGGSIAIAAYSGWSLGSYSLDLTGANGPYGVGNNAYYTGSDHQDAELASTNRISVTAGEQYFLSWRQKSGKTNKSHLHVKFYDSGGTVVGNSHGYDICKTDLADNEWGRNYGIIVVPATATAMTPVLHHESFSSSYSVYYTDIQVIKLTGAFGFSDKPLEDNAWYNSINATGVDLRDFENPSAPEESGESANRVYVYAPYTTEDPLTGAKQLTEYRNTYDFVQGVWNSGGKRIEGSIVELKATDKTTALLTAQQYFKERGIALRSYEFEHTSGKLNVGDVVPFIWNELGIAEALVVRRQVGYLIGQDVYYRVQLGGDLSFQRSTMYLVERRLREITGDAAYFSPPPSPYPGYPTEGGVVTPAVPTGNAGAKKVDLSWEYPQSIIKNASFGGFVVLRSADAGTNWVKASTSEPILTAENPLAPDSAVPSFSDTNVEAAVDYIYKVAAVDVSGPTPILTEYSTDSETLTPTDVTVDFGNAYNGLGINVPKIVNSVTYPGAGSAKTISTITSGASTTATVTTSAAHGFTTGWVVGITGASGTNSADVNGQFFPITVTTTTAFTITKTGTNSLSLTGGTATGWDVSGNFSDDGGTSRTLGDTWSLVQFPIGQIAYAESDGKLYRNGKPGTTAFDNKWTRAAVDAIDVTSDGSVVISADKITTGTLDAGKVSVTQLNATNITSGTLTSIAINAGSGTFQVTSGGALTASSANITGTITATGGAIANWDIGTNAIYNLGATKYAGIYHSTTDTGLAFFSGATNNSGSGAQFSVTNAGILTAVSASLTSVNIGAGTTPGALISHSSTYGDLAVPTGEVLSLGHWSGSAFTERLRIDASGNLRLYDGYFAVGRSTDNFSVTNLGVVTAVGDIRTNGSLVSYGGDVFIDQNGSELPILTFRNDGGGTVYGEFSHNGTNFTLSDSIVVSGAVTTSGDITTTSGSAINIITSNGIRVGAIDGIYWGTDGTAPNLYYSSGWKYTGTTSAASTVDAVWNGTSSTATLQTLVRVSSSERYKENISYLDFPLDEIVKLQPAEYQYREEWRGTDEDDNPLPAQRQVGIIAESAVSNAVWNKLVVNDEIGRPDSWRYSLMGPVLLSAVRQLNDKIASLEARIAELEK